MENLKSIIDDLKSYFSSYVINILNNTNNLELNTLVQNSYKPDFVKLHRNTSENQKSLSESYDYLARNSLNSEVMFFMHPDLKIIEEGTILKIVKILKDDKNIVTVGPKLLTGEKNNPKEQHWDHGEKFGLRSVMTDIFGGSFWKSKKEEGEVKWVTGACMAIKTDLIKKLGGFDTNFLGKKCDEDFCKRAIESVSEVFYTGENIKVYHECLGESSSADNENVAKIKYLEKHRPKIYKLMKFFNIL